MGDAEALHPSGRHWNGRYNTRQYSSVGQGGNGQSASNTVQSATGAQAGASTTSPMIYVAIGAGVGGAILIAIVVVTLQILRTRRRHGRAIAELDESQDIRIDHGPEIAEVPRPTKVARRGTLSPLHAQAGWGALSSDETLHELQSARADHGKRNSMSLPKKFGQRSIHLKRLKHLSAIMESPRSKTGKSPSPAMDVPVSAPTEQETTARKLHIMDQQAGKESDENIIACPDSPKPSVLPSFAIRSPATYGIAIANGDRPKAPRSVSVGALLGPLPESAMSGRTTQPGRAQMHGRSVSLGAPLTRPPTGPVPPLPVFKPHGTDRDERNRQGMCISRMSSSSQESASSSVLITSPIMAPKRKGAINSPSLEELVADEDSAQLKTVLNRQWQNPLITGPRPMAHFVGSDPLAEKDRASIRSNMARYSTESLGSRRQPSTSTASYVEGDQNRLSIPQVRTADRVSISRVSSYDSLNTINTGGSAIRIVSTPGKPQLSTTVSANGSPAERRKTSVLRDISGNALLPSRRPSGATQDSDRSSNGNPFQWDNQPPMTKPSALKGSPNARKGHRRQNCVKISTLTPQILGPPPTRPTSPSIMQGILEESADGEEAQTYNGGTRFVTSRRLSRPLMNLRASLTPSSPTLSSWTAFQEHFGSGLPSQHSDSQLSVSPTGIASSRQSDRSSAFSIPNFPSPSKAIASVCSIQHEQPVPQFYLSRPSTDSRDEASSSPFQCIQLSPHDDMPSSPPLPVSKHKEYDPALPMIRLPAPKPEYDPASPHWENMDPKRSSPFFPFASARSDMDTITERNEHISPRSLAFAKIKASDKGEEEQVSPRTRPTSYGGIMPDTPPCSPKTLPEGFRIFFEEGARHSPRAAEKLTSANASAIMASLARVPSVVDFPGAPILSPPHQDHNASYIPSSPRARKRRVSSAAHLQPTRAAPPPPVPSIKTCITPSPLHIKSNTSPQGPRSEPSKSVLTNIMALRRMNSEIDQTRYINRECRRFVSLGREASPLLPFLGSPDPNESYDDLFDFDFDADVQAGADEDGADLPSALDEIDMSDIDRRLDGALAGFDAGPGSSVDVSRSSSLWDDGERFWQPQDSKAGATDFGAMPEFDLTGFDAKGLSTPVGNLKMPALDMEAMRMPPSSMGRTPKSLYDSEGFLKT